MSTRSSTDSYIVVLDAAEDVVRALLFDSEAHRVEGYSAQLPQRADAAADCLDEMHRLVQADQFRIGAVMGRAESEVTAEDRKFWTEFEGARWFPALPDGAGAMLGCGCAGRERFGLVVSERSMLGTVVEARPSELPAGLSCVSIDERRWLVYGAVPEAGGAYGSLKQALKQALKARGSIEGFIENAPVDEPLLAPLLAVARRFREVYETLSQVVGKPAEVIACGSTLLKSPAWTQRIAGELGASLVLCTEPEPACRGAALWALEWIGVLRLSAS